MCIAQLQVRLPLAKICRHSRDNFVAPGFQQECAFHEANHGKRNPRQVRAMYKSNCHPSGLPAESGQVCRGFTSRIAQIGSCAVYQKQLEHFSG